MAKDGASQLRANHDCGQHMATLTIILEKPITQAFKKMDPYKKGETPMNTPIHKAKRAVLYLEEAILDVLEDASLNGIESLEPNEISRKLGLPGWQDENMTTTFAIVTGVLVKLKETDGRVERAGIGHWRLTNT